MLSTPEVPENQRAAPASPPRKVKKAKPPQNTAPKSPEPNEPKPALPRKEPPAQKHKNVFHFNPEPKTEDAEESEEVTEIKNQVRRAMKVLEDGKAVAAFNLMKSIVER